MARIAAEARVDQREWTLVFKAGWQRRLRVDGFFAGHNSKEELKAGITEELRRLNAVDEEEVNLNGEEVGNLVTCRIAKLPPPDSAASKTGVETTYSSSVCNGRSTELRGGPGLGCRRPPVAAHHHRGARENSGELKEWTLSKVGDVVLARELDDFQGSSGASSSSPSPDNIKLRKKKFVAAESFLSGDRSPEQLWPALSPKVVAGLLPAAGLLEDTAPAHMDDEGSESSMDDPVIRAEVDNFVLHANDKLVSVTTLPVYIDGVLTGGVSPPEKVYVVGTVGPDCVLFKKRVEMWRLMLDPTRRPQFLLKTKKGSW